MAASRSFIVMTNIFVNEFSENTRENSILSVQICTRCTSKGGINQGGHT